MLEAAGRDDRHARAELDEAPPLEHAEQAVLVQAERGRVGEHADPPLGGDLRRELRRDVPAGPSFERPVGERTETREQPATQARLVIDQDDRRARGRCFQRRRHARHAAARDGDVREEVFAFVVARRLPRERDPAEPRKTLQHALVHGPEPPRVNEGLIVEPHRQEPMELVEHREHVALERRPRVLRRDGHPGAHRLRAGPHVRDPVDVDEAVRAPAGAAEEPARAVVLEAAAHDSHAGRVERRAHRVALERAHAPSGEGELKRLRPVDALSGTWRETVHHQRRASGFVPWLGSGQKVRSTALVRVSRTARNQRRQPMR